MAIRYVNTFYSELNGFEWTINFHDNQYVSGTPEGEFETYLPGFTMNREGVGGERYAPISKSSVVVHCKVQVGSDFESLLDDMMAEQEQRYYVEILKDDVLYWRGNVMQDVVRVEDIGDWYQFDLTASDGLAQLEALEQTISFDSCLGLLVNALKSIEVTELWGATDTFISTCVRYYPKEYTSATGVDPLSYTSVSDLGLVYSYQDGEAVYNSYYYMVEQIMLVYGATLFQEDGYWHVVQVNEKTNSSFKTFQYSKSYALTGGDPASPVGLLQDDYTINNVLANFKCMAGASYSYKPALKYVRQTLTYEQSKIPWGKGWGDPRGTHFGGDVYLDDDAVFRCRGYCNITVDNANLTNSITYDVVVQVGISVNGWTFIDNNTVPGPIWGDSASYGSTRSFWSRKVATYTVPFDESHTVPIRWDFVTTAFNRIGQSNTATGSVANTPADRYAVGVVLDIVLVRRTQVVGNPLSIIGANGEAFVYYTKDETATSTYQVDNTAQGKSSQPLVLPGIILGDTTAHNFVNNMLYWNSSASIFKTTEDWKREATGTAEPIQDLRLKDILAGQKSPVKLFDLKYQGDFSYRRRITHNSTYYQPIGGSFRAASEMIEMQAIEIDIDSTGASVGSGSSTMAIATTGTSGGDPSRFYADVVASLVGALGVGVVSADLSGTIDTIEVYALTGSGLKNGDTLKIVDTLTGNALDITLDADAASSAESLSIDEITLGSDEEITAGAVIIYTGMSVKADLETLAAG